MKKVMLVALVASVGTLVSSAFADKIGPNHRGDGSSGSLVYGERHAGLTTVPNGGQFSPITASLPPITLTPDDLDFQAGVLDVSGVPAGSYNHITVTTDWSNGSGADAFSAEASFAVATGTDSSNAAPIYKFQTYFPNGTANNTSHSLTYSGYLYQAYTAGSGLTLFGTQDFDFATWSNTTVTLEQVALPSIPVTAASQGGSINAGALGAGQSKFYKFAYDGNALTIDTEGSTASADTFLALFNSTGGLEAVDDEGGTASLSSLAIPAGVLPAGDYYLGVIGWTSGITADDGLVLTSPASAAIGNIHINGISVVAPEPASLAALALVGTFFRRRR